MSKPVDDAGANGDANGAGRFWDLYGTASSPRTRVRTEPPPASEPEPDAAPEQPENQAPPGYHAWPPGPDDHANSASAHGAPGNGDADGAEAHACLEWCPICRGAEVLRAGGSPEIRGQLQAVQRDSLMMLRALIDSYLARPPAPPPGGSDGVEDIPIT